MKKTTLIIIGVLVLLLAGAAFMAGKLFQVQRQATAANNVQDGPRKLVTPAAGVPTTPPDARGQVTRRDDNSLFICDPNDTMTINPDGTVNEGGCGPTFEVVIGHDTVLLHDITAKQYVGAPTPGPGQNMVLQQAVEPGSANDIGNGTVIRAWGELTGDRILASTILYWNRPSH